MNAGAQIAYIGDCDCHGLGDGMGITGLGGLDLQVVNIVAARIGRGLMVGADLPANHTAAAVDAEFGGIIPAADAETDAAVAIGGRSSHGIDRAGGVFGKRRAAAAGDAGRSFHHIAHRHHHAAGGGIGVARFGGFDFQVVSIVVARIGRVFKVGAALGNPPHHCCC